MRKLLLTTAFALPLGLTAAIAQDAPVPADEPAQPGMAQTEPMGTSDNVDPMASDRLEADPMADPMTAPMNDDMVEDDADPMAAQIAASDKVVQQQAPNELRIDWITGTTVEAPDGTNVGSIKDLIVDGETGELKAAIVGVGGFLGIGQKDIALPWDQLSINFDAREITSEITREEADAAPEYVFRDQADRPASDGMGTDPAMAPAGDPAMAPAGDPAMAPAGDPAMAPGGDPAMAPAGDPAMAPAGDPANPPAEDMPADEAPVAPAN